MNSIHFFSEDVDFELKHSEAVLTWIESIVREHGCTLTEINYIFCSDDYLLDINKQYLSHDYYTDIITFNNGDTTNELEADIFISIDRVKDNARESNNSFDTELYRVMVHGILHLLGYDDKTQEQKKEMRRKEDACLSLLDI